MTTDADAPGTHRARRLGFFARHRRIVICVVIAAVILIGGAGYYAYNLNAKLGNIDRVNVGPLGDRDADSHKAMNILFLGSDGVRGEKSTASIAQDAKSGDWPRGKHRSDTIMVAHITANRKHVYLTSIPRDTFTTIYNDEGKGTDKQKINAAFSLYGPSGAISTVENFTGLSMSHMAIMDWGGFKDLSSAVGGVRVYIPEDSYDDAQNIQWSKGWHTLKGDRALSYVRTRHGLPEGDFDRIARQQNFMRSLMHKVLESGSASNPVKLSNTVEVLTQNLTVDSQWTNGELRSLAMSLRDIDAEDVTFLSLPVAGTQHHPQYGDIVDIDEEQAAELFDAFENGTVDNYVAEHPDAELADSRDVS